MSCSIGLAKEFITQKDIYEELEKVQCIIQDLQSAIATPRNSARESQIEKTKWDINHLVDLENWIDRHSDGLPPLKNFILPVSKIESLINNELLLSLVWWQGKCSSSCCTFNLSSCRTSRCPIA